MEKIEIGKVSAPVAMKGEIKILSYSDEPDRFETIGRVIIGGTEHEIESVRYKGAAPIIKVSGIDDRDASEAAKGKPVYMYAEDLPELEEGEFYVRDMIGAAVVREDGSAVGTLKDISGASGQDMYIVEREGAKDLLIPGVPEFICDVDLESRKVTVRLIDGLEDL
ncbi:MAG: ribosome maturation factor RimM [Anaerovoracaceae bacterium]|nr:ribosome maturation factor RimM [Anaerovoracaceae bacterium]